MDGLVLPTATLDDTVPCLHDPATNRFAKWSGWMNLLRCLCVPALAMLLAACGSNPTKVEQSPLATAGQVVLVTSPDWNAPGGTLRTFERTEAGWREVGQARKVTLGRAGSAWGIGLHAPQLDGPRKREGDGRSPAGIFLVGEAFGYPEHVDTGLDYHPMDAGDWCVDVSGSLYYNRIVNVAKVGGHAVEGSSEPMRRDLHADGDQRYRIGFVVEHNAAGADRGGSCIFAHVWKSPDDATAGCTAMSDANMQQLLGWLDRRRNPMFILLPEDAYAQLRAEWMLP
jgi:L,D-peptidoglycan transpeptidase YkuD (ErfK/YbiS/YcfS/YnhG family)